MLTMWIEAFYVLAHEERVVSVDGTAIIGEADAAFFLREPHETCASPLIVDTESILVLDTLLCE